MTKEEQKEIMENTTESLKAIIKSCERVIFVGDFNCSEERKMEMEWKYLEK